jgi:hypothetical protein
MEVKAMREFMHNGYMVRVGETGPLEDQQLADAIAEGTVTKNLAWMPPGEKPTQVKAIVDLRLSDGTTVKHGAQFEVGGWQLEMLLENGKVTKNLGWTLPTP